MRFWYLSDMCSHCFIRHAQQSKIKCLNFGMSFYVPTLCSVSGESSDETAHLCRLVLASFAGMCDKYRL